MLIFFQAFHANHTLGAVHEEHPAAQAGEGIDPADRQESGKTIIIHMRDHQTDFVNMRRNHDPFSAFFQSTFSGDQVSERVGIDLIGVPLNFRFDLFSDHVFRAGRSGRLNQGLKNCP